ncbi:predicted protein [Aspergillus terreus NIH2624]|jgi:hypothetical protein|uniref:Uncharacterized protein n=1 Tax=Aspergillus terreus (strain NIH 2624 / FGSC A1156) TaxID=341663 RepID=Q0CIU3_ASPTN|nr:uncharacterized protein ATEG_06391 [Aspergillus terreus NIH2624]EAU32935.1 predicted protein [Aspergillus terreus NIH2624]
MSASDHQNVFPGPPTGFSEFQTVVRPGDASRLRRSATDRPYPSSSSSTDPPKTDNEEIVEPWKTNLTRRQTWNDKSDSEEIVKAWKPTPNRRQSWNEQEMRHQFQSHLFNLEEGKKTGFTEVSHEVQ